MKEYRVIEIVDEYEIIINYGSESGSKENEKVKIVERGRPVIDPETNEVLGTRDAIKAILVIHSVSEKFSTCRNRRITYNSLLNPTLQLFKTTVDYEKLHVDPKEITDNKVLIDNPIRVGDKVIVD